VAIDTRELRPLPFSTEFISVGGRPLARSIHEGESGASSGRGAAAHAPPAGAAQRRRPTSSSHQEANGGGPALGVSGGELPVSVALTSERRRPDQRRRVPTPSPPYTREKGAKVEDNPDMWAPHVSEMREREKQRAILSIRIYSTPIRLTVGSNGLQEYIMAYLKHLQNCNGSGIVS
jgi:hypothetical protein